MFLDIRLSPVPCSVGTIEYDNSILTGISSYNIHRLQRVQNSLAQVVTRSTTLIFILSLLIQYSNALITHWLLLSTVHSIMPALSVSHRCFNIAPRNLRSTSLKLISQPGFKITLASLWNSLLPHLQSTDFYPAFKSNLSTQILYTTFSTTRPSFASNISARDWGNILEITRGFGSISSTSGDIYDVSLTFGLYLCNIVYWTIVRVSHADDTRGTPGLSCCKSADRRTRNNAVNDLICRDQCRFFRAGTQLLNVN